MIAVEGGKSVLAFLLSIVWVNIFLCEVFNVFCAEEGNIGMEMYDIILNNWLI